MLHRYALRIHSDVVCTRHGTEPDKREKESKPIHSQGGKYQGQTKAGGGPCGHAAASEAVHQKTTNRYGSQRANGCTQQRQTQDTIVEMEGFLYSGDPGYPG